MRIVVSYRKRHWYGSFKRHEHCDIHANKRGQGFRIGVYELTLDDGSVIFRCYEHVFTDLLWTSPAEMKKVKYE